ncbi:3-deoxy-D-manno-octulosonic acid transferase [Roseateles koreensis]|uniref:3-deoxy-D-manno-octulosonic acid transferase n=1 Tax=Roseateles koreensis TaxID=2987526 RepID=A0ABT5KUP8_9BURK|nr:glycosyltransferase N-terminal domain-containing protein [Roseateles koreensis]MDC8786160.1 glycosyltransferase N-terminal domain-containing protein [Roseateles koreensis]
MSTPLPLRTHLKWWLFRSLELLSDLRGNSASGHLALPIPPTPQKSLWVFVSTIGELNAIEPLLRQILQRLPALKLVLITDHAHYQTSYLARYPEATICVSRGHASDANQLAKHYPPQWLFVGEIPCWPSDAPCRFSFAFMMAAKKAGAKAALLNGWLYHYAPPSRMDKLERQLLQRDYLRGFDAIAAQTEEVRQLLLNAGAEPDRVAVTGNIKFDGMLRQGWSAANARSPVMLQCLIDQGRPVIVTGCVTNFDEQTLVLDAFIQVKARHPSALLILAPRHPEVLERMQTLREYLSSRNLRAVFRSTFTDSALDKDLDCLVLDTIGELRDFYACATAAHVGVDHNVLEPLGFGTPVTVCSGWNPTYPSYPVYQMMSKAGAIVELAEVEQLAAIWNQLISDPQQRTHRVSEANLSLASARGAVQRHLDLLSKLLPMGAAP